MGIHSKDEKYREAVDRSISYAKKKKKYLNTQLKITGIKIKLGIRKNDESYNDTILVLTGANTKT